MAICVNMYKAPIIMFFFRTQQVLFKVSVFQKGFKKICNRKVLGCMLLLCIVQWRDYDVIYAHMHSVF